MALFQAPAGIWVRDDHAHHADHFRRRMRAGDAQALAALYAELDCQVKELGRRALE